MSLLDAPAIRAATMAEVGTLLRSLKLPPGTALAATGSFARGEMTPYSDIDLLLIHPDGTQHPQADGVWYPIWDAKKRLDYAVRTPRECEEMVATDTTAALALLELRPIAGDAQLVEEAIQRVRTRWRRSVPKTFNTVVDTAIARWNRSGSVVAMTRPDVKHGRGGLRDIELLKALALGNVCDAPPLEEQRRLLLDIRTLLHVETRRSRDVLDPECATDIATHLGFDDRLGLSRALADAARTIDATLTQALTTARHVLRRPRNYRRRPVDLGVVDAGDELRLSRNQSLDDPGLVLRVGAGFPPLQLRGVGLPAPRRFPRPGQRLRPVISLPFSDPPSTRPVSWGTWIPTGCGSALFQNGCIFEVSCPANLATSTLLTCIA